MRSEKVMVQGAVPTDRICEMGLMSGEAGNGGRVVICTVRRIDDKRARLIGRCRGKVQVSADEATRV